MAIRQEFVIKGSTADGELLSKMMNLNFETGFIKVLFYTDDTYTTTVTPSAGSITFTASEEGETYGSISSGSVDATLPGHPRPNWVGPSLFVKGECLGIVGASHYRAVIYRRGD